MTSKFKVGDWVIFTHRDLNYFNGFTKGKSYQVIELCSLFNKQPLIRVIDDNNRLNGWGGSNDMWILDTRCTTALWKVLYE